MALEIERLYEWFSSIEINEYNIFDIFSNEDKRNLMYKYFNKREKMEELCEELIERQEKEDERYLKFIENTILLYPITKKLIFKLNEEQLKAEGKTLPALLKSNKYVGGFYNGLLKDFKELLNKTKNNSAIKKLNEEMEELDDNIEEYKNQIEEIKKKTNKETISKAAKREKLKKEYEELIITTDIKKLDEDIEKYEEEIKKIKSAKNAKVKEKNELYQQLKKLESDELEDKEREAIKILASIWQKDESEN